MSLDEVTCIDNTSCICMSIYMANNHIRHSYLLEIHKMRENSTVKNIYELVTNSLKKIGGMDNLMITKKLVCVREDVSLVVQGHMNVLCVRLQLSHSLYMLNIDCMTHRMNLTFKTISKFPLVSKFEDLVQEAYAFFFRSLKQF